MKPPFLLTTLLLSTLLFGFSTLKRSIRINGHFDGSCGARACWAFVPVFIKSNNEVLDKTITDENGSFQLTFDTNEEKSFDLYFVFSDTLIFASFISFHTDTVDLNVKIPVRSRNSNAQITCPKCHRSDKVQKYDYSDNKSDTTYLNVVRLAGLYYCGRDNVKF